MRIGIDARELSGRVTGVGRYLGGLLREWSADERARTHEFVLYGSEPIAMALDARRFATRLVRGAPGTWWEQIRLPRAAERDHLDVFFAPAYTAPLRLQVPTVITIHDLSYVAHPEWFRLREGMRRRWLTRRSVARASVVITVSDWSRREIVERLGVPENRVRVIPQGIEAGGLGLRTGSVIPSHQPPATSLLNVLFVGSIFNRRHVSDLIRAFAALAERHPGVSLDLVGDNRTYPYEDVAHVIDVHGMSGRVRWHRYVTDDRLRDLYARARAFAFLSEYEGLGMTPLEALATGVPPVLLDTPVARESCGDAALYVPPNDLAATTRAIESALFDESIRARLLSAAPAALAKYSWPRAARETLTVLERCAS